LGDSFLGDICDCFFGWLFRFWWWCDGGDVAGCWVDLAVRV
jgi:hypothetical protein